MDPNDDDTVARRGRPADFVSVSSTSAHALPEGTRLLDYEITGLIGEGGFGIVYLAWDHSLQRRIAIKEYMPSSMASRAPSSAAVVLKSERHAETFSAGLKSFVNEARLLARFNHSALVRVYRFWEQNGTAYMVMPHYAGPTLKQVLAVRHQPPDEAEWRAWLRPLLDALTVMHAAHCLHRDIAPDNILLTPSGPLLLDFGAARRVIGDMTHALTVVLKPGFAPIEQYGDVATMAQGAWTDLYALASVVYAGVAGKPPMSSVERLMDDRLLPFSELASGRYSAAFIAAIDAALAVRPRERPQDVASFRALLDGRAVDHEDAQVVPQAGSTATPWRDPARDPRASPQGTAPASVPAVSGRLGATNALGTRRLRPGTAAAAGVLTAVLLAAAAYLAANGRRAGVPASTGASSATARIAFPPPLPAPPSMPAPTAAPAGPIAAPMPVTPEHLVPSDAPPLAKARQEPRVPPPRRTPRVPADGNAGDSVRAKCGDILQKASLEPLTAGEAAYLKRECR